MAGPSTPNAIEVEHLSKTYGTTAAIEDVVFTVKPGEIVGFLGPNGAGKTTTMRILTGYLPATSGTARIAGFDVHTQSMEVRKRIGYLPELPPLYPGMTVTEYLFFVARIKGVRRSDRAAAVQRSIQACGLEEKTETLIRKLSKGYRQRVGLAQAIVHDPPVIILDEPTVGLDPRQIIEVRNLIKGLAGDRTIILSTHILPEASMICDRVTIINQGRVVATDTPENLMSQMVGGTQYTLEVNHWQDLLAPKIENISGVQQLEVESIESPDERQQLQVTCTPESEPGNTIARTLIQWGVAIHEMRRTRPSLEDVFLELTTQEEPISEFEAGPPSSEPDQSERLGPESPHADADKPKVQDPVIAAASAASNPAEPPDAQPLEPTSEAVINSTQNAGEASA
ncbi:MAG: ABC transporter ATP-binding protein [Spirulina sp. SIO3F2]|nr:ABC transporter ATP-binding protein [Spirulina sp. SIO3F2]